MANNITVDTLATDPVVATVDRSGVHYQVVDASADRVAAATLTNVADSASSQTLAASNTARTALYVFNDSTVDLYIKLGTTASTTSFTVKLAAGAFWEMPNRPIYTGIVTGIWTSDAAGSARVTEL